MDNRPITMDDVLMRSKWISKIPVCSIDRVDC